MRYIVLIMTIFLAKLAFAGVDLVKVVKSENKMYLFDGRKIIKQYHVAVGENPRGHKQRKGDKKTPEGYYILDYKKEDSVFYRAMHISYPNETDRENAKKKGVSPGGLIMIHGQHNRSGRLAPALQKINWTDGCIALTNPQMDEFMSLVEEGTLIKIEW
jgi:murein L,D-transpeptidase YafK